MALIRKKSQGVQMGGGAPVLPGAPQQRSPSGFVNLNELLGLNHEKAEQMGHSLVDPAQKQAEAAKAALGGAQGTFEQQKQAGTLTYKPGATQGSATQMAGGYYSGPSSLEDASPGLQQKVHGAAQNVAQVGTQTGRMSLLQQQQKQSEYGAGASALDSYLAGQGAKPELAALQSGYGNLEQMLGLSEAQAGREAGLAAKSSRDAANRYAADALAEPGIPPSTANADQAKTDARNEAMRGKQQKGKTNPDQRTQQLSDLDWMLKSGKISPADYDRAMDDGNFYQSLLARYG